MSHRAVNWALEQRQVKPGPWRVLVMLADRHNKDTRHVYPPQDRLAADCNMSRATVNRHLDELEEMGLVRRVRRQDPVTKRRLPTFYILGLDFDAPPSIAHAVSPVETWVERGGNENTGPSDGALHVSNCDMEPCLNFDESHVSKSADSMSQFETLTMEGNLEEEPCAGGAQAISENSEEKHETRTPDLADRIAEFGAVYPRLGDGEAVEAAFRGAVQDGVDPARIVAAARAYAAEQSGNAPRFIALPENWLRRRGWERQPEAAPKPDKATVLTARAKMIRDGAKKPYLVATMTAVAARECVAAGLVTEAECRAARVLP